MNLSAFANEATRTYDFQKLYEVTKVVTKNLNRVIDVNFYPVEEARNSNMRHRPIGIGVQGLADAFCRMRYAFESDEARQLNKEIFETMYYAAVEASCEVAAVDGPYSTYAGRDIIKYISSSLFTEILFPSVGSPMSRGILQPDMWAGVALSTRWDWAALREKVARHGVRNSLLMAPMPTASTAQIMGNNESTEPFTSNMYNRRVLAGEFTVVNKYLLKDLVERGLWTSAVRNQIIADKGSVQGVRSLPQDIKELYKTVWEIKQKVIIDMSADRGAFICQSQSLNIHMAEPSTAKLTSMHFYAWKKGLKTGMYYLRTRPKADAIQFTVDQTELAASKKADKATGVALSLVEKENHLGVVKGLDTEEEPACANCSA